MDGKTWRIGKTRVLLDTVIFAYNNGLSQERIVEEYIALEIEDVCAVVTYYLSNRAAMDEYVAHRYEEAMRLKEKMLKEHLQDEIRARLSARRAAMKMM